MKRLLSLILIALLLTGIFNGCAPNASATVPRTARQVKVFSSQYLMLALGSDGKLWGYGDTFSAPMGGQDRVALTQKQRDEVPEVIKQYVSEENDFTGIYNVRLIAENVVDFSVNGYLLILCEDGSLYDYRGMRCGVKSDDEELVPLYKGVAKLCGDSLYSFILEDGTVIVTDKMTNDKEHYTACEGLSGQELYQFSEKAKMVYDRAYIDLKDNLWVHGFNSYGWLGNGKQDSIAMHDYMKTNTFPEYDINEYHKVLDDVASFSCVSLVLGVALKNDGSLWMWGANEYGTVGNGEMGDGYFDIHEVVTKPIKVLDNVVEAFPSRREINIGNSIVEHTVVALTSDGDVYTWGANRHGLVGNGTVAADGDVKLGSVPTPTKILSGVKDIAKIYGCRGGTFYALKNNGELYAWGNSVCGEVGNGVKQECFDDLKMDNNAYRVGTPAKIAEGVNGFYGYMTPIALKTNGNILTWGYCPLGLVASKDRYTEGETPGAGRNMIILSVPVVHPQLSATIGADGTVSFVPTPVE